MVGDEDYATATTDSVSGLLDAIERNAAMVAEIVASGELREPEPE
jgi:hypothetical protein